MPLGSLKPAGTPPTPIPAGAGTALTGTPPAGEPGAACIEVEDPGAERGGMGGAPCLPSRKFFNLSCMSSGAFMPPLLENVAVGCGLRAAFVEPSGVDELVIPAPTDSG